MTRTTTITALQRTTLLLAISIYTAGCEAIANIFQAGFVIGIVIVLLILGVIAWLVGRRGGTPS